MYYHEDEVNSEPPAGAKLLARYLKHLAVSIIFLVAIGSCSYLYNAFWNEENTNKAFDWIGAKEECSGKSIRSVCGEGVCTDDGRVVFWNRCVLNPKGAPKSGLYCVAKTKSPIIYKCYFGCCNTRSGLACRSNYINCID